MSIMSDENKAMYNAALQELHEFWARDIVYYKTAEQVDISTDVTYNPFYGQASNSSVEFVPISGVAKARIFYGHNLERDFVTPQSKDSERFRLQFDNSNKVRIKLDKETFEKIKDSKKYIFDGNTFELDTIPRPHGLFDPQYYTLYLKYVN